MEILVINGPDDLKFMWSGGTITVTLFNELIGVVACENIRTIKDATAAIYSVIDSMNNIDHLSTETPIS